MENLIIINNKNIKEYLTDESTFSIWVIGFSVYIRDLKTDTLYRANDRVNVMLCYQGDLDYINFLLLTADYSKLISYNR